MRRQSTLLAALSWTLLLAVVFVGARLEAQDVHMTTPPSSSVLAITRRWARTSKLGDLTSGLRDSSDVELRVWSGYGVAGTNGLVLRRHAGKWRAIEATVEQCLMPIGADEELTEARLAQLAASARRHGCPDFEGTFETVYWLTLRERRPGLDLEDVWRRLSDAGLLRLPPDPHPTWHAFDGHTYVVEVRVGNVYRASVVPWSESSSDEVDNTIRRIRRILGDTFSQSRE